MKTIKITLTVATEKDVANAVDYVADIVRQGYPSASGTAPSFTGSYMFDSEGEFELTDVSGNVIRDCTVRFVDEDGEQRVGDVIRVEPAQEVIVVRDSENNEYYPTPDECEVL